MRLGDDIDDYCSRCKRSTDHSIVSIVDEEAKRVRCRTCSYEHTYHRNKGGPKEMTAQEAFAKVLASVTPGVEAAVGKQPRPRKRKP